MNQGIYEELITQLVSQNRWVRERLLFTLILRNR